MTEKSNSIGWRLNARREAAARRRRRSLHGIDDPRFVLLELRLDLLLDRARPLQKCRLVLVDGHADRRRLFRAVLAVVLFRQYRQLLQLAAHRDPWHAVD